MAKDPAFLFYPGDWLGGTLGMTLEEKGAYMELLILQFNRGHMTSHMIGHMIGQVWENIKDKFEMDEDGKYFNARLDREKEKRKKYSESRKNNIMGINQHSDTEKKGGHMTTHMGAHMTNHMENENIYVDNNNINNNKVSKNYLDLSHQIMEMDDEQKKERGQAFYEDLVKNKSWQDLVKMSNSLPQNHRLEVQLAKFLQEVIAGDDIYMNRSQLKKYFTKWIKRNK